MKIVMSQEEIEKAIQKYLEREMGLTLAGDIFFTMDPIDAQVLVKEKEKPQQSQFFRSPPERPATPEPRWDKY